MIKRIVDITKSRNQKYTQEDIGNILTAFADVVIDAVRNGDFINLNGYVSIKNKYMASHKARNVAENTEVIVPEHYKVKIEAGSKLNNAAMIFTEKQLGGRRHE